MEIGLGETVFPFQMILASGKYMIGISYQSVSLFSVPHPEMAEIGTEFTFARRDGSSKAS